MTLMAVFLGGVALLLAAAGLYGLLALAVATRTPEIGLRLALGAMPGSVLRMVLRDSLRLALPGLALGLGAAVALSRFAEALLSGVTATDPGTFAIAAALTLTVALVASAFPAIRASRVNLVTALGAE